MMTTPKKSLKPESVWIRGDLYGPPDPVSNLPHIKFMVRENETHAERKLREMRQEAHEWNHTFWHGHNTKFLKEKEDYITRFPNRKLSADEMSVFYKDFLDRNRNLHRAYNMELYSRNFRLLWPELLVSVERLIRRLRL
ncbi:cytochrome c oxidase assembly factor 8-like [Paramacrobiotus metropolitanus]|uniref:cytochrome c oxidase assembly factor 8-like n=1 Tax=Paramacrobiotus metropolitanus TaxID=2943436 RepID=UPI002445913F|nr:cytochrome c oxidase assembly factor 8-like [Paramacrobiotus metropolitanus]